MCAGRWYRIVRPYGLEAKRVRACGAVDALKKADLFAQGKFVRLLVEATGEVLTYSPETKWSWE